MLHAITLLAAMSATTGFMSHGKHCGGGRMHLGHGRMVHAAAPMSTCGGAAQAPTMPMMTAYPATVATPQTRVMPQPMATPSAPMLTPTPSDTVPPAPAVPPAPSAPAPPAPPAT